MNEQQIITSIIPYDELTTAAYIVLITVGITHSVKFILKNLTQWKRERRRKTLYATALVSGAVLAYVMWPEGSVAPWWAVAWALGPLSNLVFLAGMKPVEVYFPKLASVLNFEKPGT